MISIATEARKPKMITFAKRLLTICSHMVCKSVLDLLER